METPDVAALAINNSSTQRAKCLIQTKAILGPKLNSRFRPKPYRAQSSTTLLHVTRSFPFCFRAPATRHIFDMGVRLCRVAILTACLGGCSTVQNYLGDQYIQPAKFQYLRCEDIAKKVIEAENSRAQLQALMDRAATGAGGTAVNFFVYQPQFEQVQAELRSLRQTAGEKRCSSETTNPPPATLSPVH
jgi:hypothetical protein